MINMIMAPVMSIRVSVTHTTVHHYHMSRGFSSIVLVYDVPTRDYAPHALLMLIQNQYSMIQYRVSALLLLSIESYAP